MDGIRGEFVRRGSRSEGAVEVDCYGDGDGLREVRPAPCIVGSLDGGLDVLNAHDGRGWAGGEEDIVGGFEGGWWWWWC